jgi:hypothetical protein
VRLVLTHLDKQRKTDPLLKENPYQPDSVIDNPPTKLIIELSRQLNAWREHLPPALNWKDEDEPDFTAHPIRAAAWQLAMLRDQSVPAVLDNSVVLNASLRTRYKYAQYLILRPYIYRVLHFPNASTEEDIQGCREAFKVNSKFF